MVLGDYLTVLSLDRKLSMYTSGLLRPSFTIVIYSWTECSYHYAFISHKQVDSDATSAISGEARENTETLNLYPAIPPQNRDAPEPVQGGCAVEDQGCTEWHRIRTSSDCS